MSETSTDTAGMRRYSTKNIHLAAFIWCQKGAEMHRIEGQEGSGKGVLYFIFHLPISEEGLKKILYDYANEKCCVEPQAYVRKQNNLRDLLHANLRKQRAEKNGNG